MSKFYLRGVKKLSVKTFIFFTFVSLCSVNSLKAQFSGSYAPANWTLANLPSNTDGSVDVSAAPASITLTSGASGNQGDTYLQITVPVSGTISFNWSYTTNDGPDWDYPKYSINGVLHDVNGYNEIGDMSQSGTQPAITVTAGDVFALVMETKDGGGPPGITVFSNFSGPISPLAITLVDIIASNTDGHNTINWSTAKEDRGDYFELERSADGKNFARITTVKANETASKYAYTDWSPVSGTNYYRLKMNDVSGKGQYSKVVTATAKIADSKTISLRAYPNPATDHVTISIGNATPAGQLSIMDVTGRVMQSVNVTNANTSLNTESLPKGVYTVVYKTEEKNETIQIVKQ